MRTDGVETDAIPLFSTREGKPSRGGTRLGAGASAAA